MTAHNVPHTFRRLCLLSLLATAAPSCSADRTQSDASVDAGVASDGGGGRTDLGLDGTDLSVAFDHGDGVDGGTVTDGGLHGADASGGHSDAGIQPAPGWIDGALHAFPTGVRVTASTFPDGRAALMFDTAANSNELEVLAWSGAPGAPWTDLGVVNAGVAGALEPLNNYRDLHMRLVHVGERELLAVFQQDGAIYSNHYDGSAWSTPRVVEVALSTVTLSGDGGGHAILVYGVGDEVRARFYDPGAHAFGSPLVVSATGGDLGLPLQFLSRAEVDSEGNATVFFRTRHPGLGTYSIHGFRYTPSDGTFVSELPVLSGLPDADRLCSAGNARGDLVFSFNERFSAMGRLFDRVRHVYRDAVDGFGAISDTHAEGLIPHVRSCAISANGDAVVAVVNHYAAVPAAVPIRYTGGVATTDAALSAPVPVGGSRPVASMAASGLGAISWFRTDARAEVALQANTAGAYAMAPFLTVPSVIDTSLDLFFKASQRMDDGRFLQLYQTGNNALRFAVLYP
ncbi:MAG: hypothetical protein H6726_14940 [Sandaracinaceae bacterium]|nr:hypothetical protein [Myxococcales bacterium]MCB9658945.1 hypothetical protein [Sandaracinaceae bacterium]